MFETKDNRYNIHRAKNQTTFVFDFDILPKSLTDLKTTIVIVTTDVFFCYQLRLPSVVQLLYRILSIYWCQLT